MRSSAVMDRTYPRVAMGRTYVHRNSFLAPDGGDETGAIDKFHDLLQQLSEEHQRVCNEFRNSSDRRVSLGGGHRSSGRDSFRSDATFGRRRSVTLGHAVKGSSAQSELIVTSSPAPQDLYVQPVVPPERDLVDTTPSLEPGQVYLSEGGQPDSSYSLLAEELMPAPLGDTIALRVRESCSSESSLALEQKSEGQSNLSLPIFPSWFDPQGTNGGLDAAAMSDSGCLFGAKWSEPAPESGCLAIDPLGDVRLTWDMFACLCLLIDLWITPFEVIFLAHVDTPHILSAFSYFITFVFTIDIVLNMATGFVHGQTKILQCRAAVLNYVRGWFLLDLLATIPFDLLLGTADAGMVSIARVAKVTKWLKTLRYLKMMRRWSESSRGTQQTHPLISHFHASGFLKQLTEPVKVLVSLVLFAHIHGCVWAFLQPDFVRVDQASEGIRHYVRSCAWAFMAISVGAFSQSQGTPLMWVFDVIIASERLIMIICVTERVMVHALGRLEDARYARLHENAITYLRQHKVNAEFQTQVWYSLQEVGRARQRQLYWDELVECDLPLELRRSICWELWGDQLMGLGILSRIGSWHSDFIAELSLLVREEVLPSKTIVFKGGETAIATYRVYDGKLRAVRGREKLPNFTKGMWVGENALVSAGLRYSATMVTKTLTILMVIHSDDFHELLSRLGLMTQFQTFCVNELWKGLCGRCGLLGNHFSDGCPMVARQDERLSEQKSANFSHMLSWTSGGKSRTMRTFSTASKQRPSDEVGPSRDLRRLLKEKNLIWLLPKLIELEVFDLDELEGLDFDMLGGDIELTRDQREALSRHTIQNFRARTSKAAKVALFHDSSRSQHLVFLSHYKVEAGTEAALMRTELEQAIQQTPGSIGQQFDEPVFLDSENLNNLDHLQQRVQNTHNVVLLLTPNVLTRPWVLVELVTAWRHGVRILLVNISRAGSEFVYPDDAFYQRLREGSQGGLLDKGAKEVMAKCNVRLEEVEDVIRAAFQQIAVPYSPHKAASIRRAEVAALIKQCSLKVPSSST